MTTTKLTLATVILCTACLWAQDAEPKAPDDGGGTSDPFASGSEVSSSAVISPERAGRTTATLLIRTEIYQVDSLDAARLLDEMGEDGARLRATFLASCGEGEASLVDAAALRVDAGLTATTEAIVESIYPTEYEPPEIATLFSAVSEASAELFPKSMGEFLQEIANKATPTAFETRNAGATHEVEARTVEAEPSTWDIRWAPEMVELIGECAWQNGALTMPTFASSRLNSSFRIRDGEWTLAGLSAATSSDGKVDHDRKRVFFLSVKKVR